jgi:hypothetical protein
MRSFFAAAIVAAILGGSNDAFAAEGVKRIGVEGGFAGVAGSEGDFSGYGGGLVGEWAVTDAWSVEANVFATSNRVEPSPAGRSRVVSESIGAVYALDVIQVVPWFGAFAAVYEVNGGGISGRTKLGAQLAFGLDYIWSRDIVIGIDLRAHAMPADFAKSPDSPTPFYATTFLKLEYSWGWF